MVQGKRLSELKIGEQAMVVSFTELSEKHVRKLLALGVIPGCTITVLQLSPTFVISYEQTQLALDREIASFILIQKFGRIK